ncbi:MAG: MBOAT family protein [bacterium]|nr:MBOAT family protein [bacterium]
MIFSSITFLFKFLPLFLMLYYLAPGRTKNYILLAGSLFFYGWGEPRYVLLMALTICAGYALGLLIEQAKTDKAKRMLTALGVVGSLGILGYFKYADFFIESFNRVTGLSLPLLRVVLPIGISFYTFQLLSYLIDIARGAVRAQKSLIHLATYIAMFPQLIAGPIVRYQDIEASLMKREHSLRRFSDGIMRFAVGLGKKVLLADTLGELVVEFKTASVYDVLLVWLYALAVALQIYFDFSGYSDMAIGLGSMMGFDFPENFRHPFMAKSVTEFWSRWHVTLGAWFRDYLYIPLGGNRVSFGKWIRNILIVWMATGLWHGASWNFVAWGLYFAVFLVLEKKLLSEFLEKHAIFDRIYMIAVLIVSFLLFDAATIGEAGTMIAMLFGAFGIPLYSKMSLFLLKDYGILLGIACIGATVLPLEMIRRMKKSVLGERAVRILEPCFLVAVLLLSTAFLINGSYHPFLYFRF